MGQMLKPYPRKLGRPFIKIQVAIIDAGGLEVLANLLETDDVKCKIGW